MGRFILFVGVMILSSLAYSGDFYTPIEGDPHIVNKFTSDGCSKFPDGFIPKKTTEFLHCCFVHDMAYWLGGSSIDRLRSDEELGYCVTNSSTAAVGLIMKYGVRIFGSEKVNSKINKKWRWGYGWNRPMGYWEPTPAEMRTVKSQVYSVLFEYSKIHTKLTEYQRNYVINVARVMINEVDFKAAIDDQDIADPGFYKNP